MISSPCIFATTAHVCGVADDARSDQILFFRRVTLIEQKWLSSRERRRRRPGWRRKSRTRQEQCGVRNCDILWTVVSLSPEHSLPVLGESIRRKVRDTVYSSSGSLQTPTLGEACQHCVGNSGVSRLLCRKEAVVLLGERN